jgi:hypothetical protein
MPGRPLHIPTYRERSALQTLLEKGRLPAANLYPAGPRDAQPGYCGLVVRTVGPSSFSELSLC